MNVALALAALGLSTYVQPSYLPILLPFTPLPPALAALLLSRRSIYVAAIATLAAIVGAALAAQFFPAPALILIIAAGAEPGLEHMLPPAFKVEHDHGAISTGGISRR